MSGGKIPTTGKIPAWESVKVGQWWRLADGRLVKVAERFALSQQLRVREKGERGEGDWLPLYFFAGAARIVQDGTTPRVEATGRRKGTDATS